MILPVLTWAPDLTIATPKRLDVSYILTLEVFHPEVVLPVIARAVVGLIVKGSPTLSLCAPHKAPLSKIQAKEGVFGASRAPLGV